MDDRIFFSVVIYLFLSSAIVGLMPESMFAGDNYGDMDSDELQATLNLTGSDIDSLKEQKGFFEKAISFLLFTWVIEGIPILLAIALNLLNFLGIFIVIVYFYDKFRGIGS